MIAQTCLRKFKCLANGILMREYLLVKLPRKEDSCIVKHCELLLDADDVLNSSIVEDLPSKLRVARGNEHKLD